MKNRSKEIITYGMPTKARLENLTREANLDAKCLGV